MENKQYRTLVCCIAKNDNHYIREWVEWYKDRGFTNIALYDNNDFNGEHFEDVIGDYIESGFVILKNYRGLKEMQLRCYQLCYNEYGNSYDWIGFFDDDEYFETDFSNVSEFLSQDMFSKYGVIRLCWKNYNDNGLIRVENDNYSITRFKTTVEEDNICNRTSKVMVKGGLPKIFIYQSPGGEHGRFLLYVGIDCNGDTYDNTEFTLNKAVWNGAWLNHYRFKTIDEFCNIKLKRLYPHVNKKTALKMLTINDFFKYNERTKEKEDFYNEYIKQ